MGCRRLAPDPLIGLLSPEFGSTTRDATPLASLLKQILQRRGRHIDRVLLAITGTRSHAHAEDKGVKTLGCLTLIQSGLHLAHGLGLSENPLEG